MVVYITYMYVHKVVEWFHQRVPGGGPGWSTLHMHKAGTYSMYTNFGPV